MATYDAGIVTAYGAAVRGGYTGTYEQFCAQQANYAQTAADVEQAKQDAQAAVQQAQDIADSIPEDYSQLSEDVSNLKEDFEDLDDRVTALEEGGTGGGLTEDIKQALLQIAEKVAYIDEDGQDYYDALEDALYPPADLVRITCVYTQSGTVYNTDTLDSLKSDLVVTAHMSDSTTQTVTNYVLSGTLAVGTSTITVSYGGKATTFAVNVTEYVPSYHTGYVEVGNPTISNNILTVADGKFIKSNELFSPGDSTWAVRCKYRRTDSLGGYTDIFGSVDSSNASARSFLVEITSSTGSSGAMYASSNGTSWNITASQVVNNIPDSSSWAYIEMSFDGSAYILKSSLDGNIWTTHKTIQSTSKIYGEYAVGFGLKRNGYLKGDIDISTCEIYIDGELWWKAIA